MRQITDARAPFATESDAIDIGLQHLRRQCAGGGAIVACVAEEQPGGYFARIVWTQPIGSGGRAGRKRRQQHTAEVGKISPPLSIEPLNDSTLSGQPYFFDGDGTMEPFGAAQARLLKAHQDRAGATP